MKNKIIPLIILIPNLLIGQMKFDCSVLDSSNNSPIAFASIMLLDSSNNVLLGNKTNELGIANFNTFLKNVKFIEVQSIGYEKAKILFPLENFNKIEIKLKEKILELESVVISSSKPPKVDFDRIEYVVSVREENSQLSDILKNIPLIQFDKNEGFTINGTSDYLILVNGKRSNIPFSMLKNKLGASIKSIEVIYAPSIKYEVQAILNITTRKDILGLNNTSFFNLGNRTSNIGSSLDYENHKILTGGQFLYDIDKIKDGYDATYKNLINEEIVNQVQQNHFKINSFDSRYYFEYDIDSLNTLGTSISYKGENHNNKSLANLIETTIDDGKNNSISATLDYLKRFQKEGRDLNLFSIYNRSTNESNVYRSSMDGISINNAFSDLTINLDYTANLSESKTLEMGLKGFLKGINSNSTSQLKIPIYFKYYQNNYSSYISYSNKVASKVDFRIGLRFNYYLGFWDEFKNTRTSFLPNLLLGYKINNSSLINFSYNTKMIVPGTDYLISTQNIFDVFNTYQGNPNLIPEISKNTELSFSYFGNKFQIRSSLYNNNINNIILTYREINKSESFISTFKNYNNLSRTGIKLYGRMKISSPLSFSTNIDLFTNKLDNLSPKFLNSSVSFQGEWKFDKLYSMNFYSTFYPKTLLPQGYKKREYFYKISIQRKIKYGGVSIDLFNVFNSKILSGYIIDNNEFSYNSANFYYSRWIKLRVYFSIGTVEKWEKSTSKNNQEESKEKEKALFNSNH